MNNSNNGPGRYRKLYPRLWRHPGFRELSELQQRIALYLVTGPQTNRVGCFYLSIATTAEDLNAAASAVRKGLVKVCKTFGWRFDAGAKVFYVPSWWRWNCPENSNVLAGNLKDFAEVPPCGLTDAFVRNLETLPQTLHQTFRERLPIRSPIQEQEQEQKQKQEQKPKDQNPRETRNACSTIADVRTHLRAALHTWLDDDEDIADGELVERIKDLARPLGFVWNTSSEIGALVDSVRGERENRRA